jgi:multiple sugar transport system permease protein
MARPLSAPAIAAARPTRWIERIVDSERWLGRLLLAPAVVYIFALVGVPFVLAVFYAFTNTTISGSSASFVGLQTIRRSVEDPGFRRALGNTFLFALVSQALVMLLANLLAIALQSDFKGKRFVRLLILLPWVAPVSLGSIGWLWIFDSIYSVINWTLRWLGFSIWPIWLGQPKLAMAAIITVHVWRTVPLATVILLGGLSSIPQDIHDAADIDGAGFFRHLFQITLPLIRPIQLVALLFGLVFAFTDMIVVYVLTRGGPYDTTQVLASLAFFKGIDGGDLASGAATALFLMPVLAAAAILMLRLARRAEVT